MRIFISIRSRAGGLVMLLRRAPIAEAVKKVHDFLTVGAAAPLQEAAVTGLKFKDEYYRELQQKYTAKRDLFLKGLDDLGIGHLNKDELLAYLNEGVYT